MKVPIAYKKSWDEDSNLPEWATESFDYGGTFDASGAFHDSEKGGNKMEKKIEPEVNNRQDVEESPSKFMNFLNDDSPPPVTSAPPVVPPEKLNGPAPIAQMDKMVEKFVAHLIMDDDPSSNVKALEWFYRDPQGDTQGPFTPSDMSEWYKAGYFQESLMVRRSIDNVFTPLGHLVKIFGAGRPFITASLDGGPPIPLPAEVLDPFRMQRMIPPPVQQQQQQPQPPQQPDNWSLMTAEQRMFFMQLAHQRPAPPVVDPYQQQQQQQPGNFFAPPPVPPQTQAPPPQQPPQPQQQEDPIQQLIMQLQMQQKTEQWMKSNQPPQQQPPSAQQIIQQVRDNFFLLEVEFFENEKF